MWVGWTLTVVFGLLGVYFYLRPRKFKRLEYYSNSVPLIERASEAIDIELLYKGQPVQKPVITQIKVRSTGSEELKPGDFESGLEIELMDVNQVLTCDLVSVRPSNLSVQYQQREKVIYCEPLLLNQDDGFDFTVITDGEPSQVCLRSRISGMSQARKVSTLPLGILYGKRAFWPDIVMGAFMAMVALAGTALVIAVIWSDVEVVDPLSGDITGQRVPADESSSNEPQLWMQLLFTVLIGAAWIAGVIVWWRSRRKISVWK